MDTTYLKDFIVLADVLNFQEAAFILNTTTSSLSRHIIALENDLDVQLFNRTTRKVELTHYGETFLSYATSISELCDKCNASLRCQIAKEQNILSIGTLAALGPYRIDKLLKQFRKNYPSVVLELHNDLSNDLIKMVMKEEITFALCLHPLFNYDNSIVLDQIIPDSFIAVMRKDHPLAKKSVIKMSDLKNEELALYPKGTIYGDLAYHACFDEGFIPHVGVFTMQMSDIMYYVENNNYISLQSKRGALTRLTENLCIVELGKNIDCSVNICYLKRKKYTGIEKQFLEFAQDWRYQY